MAVPFRNVHDVLCLTCMTLQLVSFNPQTKGISIQVCLGAADAGRWVLSGRKTH